MFDILVINPGSTSTKVALFRDEEYLLGKTIRYDTAALKGFHRIYDQLEMRLESISNFLETHSINLQNIDAFVGRGGLVRPIPSGTYTVTPDLITDLKDGVMGEHASNLGGIIAHQFAARFKKPSFIVDPVVVDELQDIARLSGHPLFPRRSIFHALNQKAAAREAAAQLGIAYEEANLIVAHMGGGISVGAHHKGRVIDVNNALDGEGPFSPERSGALVAGDVVKICFSGKYSEQNIRKMIQGAGGLAAYLGTNDLHKVRQMMQNKETSDLARLALDAMAYQIAKEIGGLAAVLQGKVDAIVFTGGISQDEQFVKNITNYVSFLGAIIIIPGEKEMNALAHGALRVLRGEEKAKEYKDHVLNYDKDL